jgi:6-phosphogluconolactonase
MVMFDPTNKFLFVPDLGADKTRRFRYDASEGKLTEMSAVDTVNKGAGPRHFRFHPTMRFAYVVNELDSTLSACTYEQVEEKVGGSVRCVVYCVLCYTTY